MTVSREYCVILSCEVMSVGDWIEVATCPRHVMVCRNFRVVDGAVDVLAATLRRVTEVVAQPAESSQLGGLGGALTEAFSRHLRIDTVDPDAPVAERMSASLPMPASLLLVEVAPEGDPAQAVVVAAARFGESADPAPVSAERAASAWRSLGRAGVRSWVIGGWGIDALVHRQTRDHHDLDLFVHADDVTTLISHLRETGSGLRSVWSENRWNDRIPSAFVADFQGIDLDVHVVEPLDERVLILSEHSIELPPNALSGSGTIAGQTVACATREAQLVMHSGYELPEQHRQDLAVLVAAGRTRSPRGRAS